MRFKKLLLDILSDDVANVATKYPLWEQIHKERIFLGLSRHEMEKVSGLLEYKTFFESQELNKPGDGNYVYFVTSGQIMLTKPGGEEQFYGSGDIANLLALANGGNPSFDALATTNVEVIVLDAREFVEEYKNTRLYSKIMQNISVMLTAKVGTKADEATTNHLSLEILTKQLLASQTRFELTQFIFKILISLSLYAVLANVVDPGHKFIYHRMLLLLGIFIIVATFIIPDMLRSYFDSSDFGFVFNRYSKNILENLWAAILLGLLLTLYKFWWQQRIPGGENLKLYAVNFGITAEGLVSPVTLISSISLVLLAPLSEFMARSGLQVPLYNLLEGSEKWRRWIAIFASNLLYSSFQVYTTTAFIMVAFLPGIVWGYLFMRHKSLLGVSISHFIFAIYAYFILDVSFIIN